MNRLAALAVALLASGCATDPDDAPSRMAALGDSVTRAAATSPASPGDAPEYSWATGSEVRSHRARLAERTPALVARNAAESGATVADLEAQARAAVRHGAEYVTVLIGANDLCKRDVDAMTTEDAFRARFRAAGEVLRDGLPAGAVVYVASIPDIARLRDVLGDDPDARRTWRIGVCASLLSDELTEEERARGAARLAAFNAILEEEARALGFAHDGGAVARFAFEREHVGTLDYWHPSVAGQRALAEVTWAAGPLSRPSG